jgi:hypothetical protein
VVFIKVDDGQYFETRVRRLACPFDAGATNLTIVAPLNSAWRPRGAGRAVWGPWSLRRVRSIGVRLYGPEAPPRVVQIEDVAARGEIPSPALTAAIAATPATGAVWRAWQADFTLTREYENPFDPQQIDLWGVFTSPTGAIIRVPAFYTCDYRRAATPPVDELLPDGPPHWSLRFLPPLPGAWTWRLEGRDHTGATLATANRSLAIAPATTPGPVRAEPGQPWFRRANGDFFYPITINIR